MGIGVRTCSTLADKQRSLEIYNEVWPGRAVTAEDVQAWERMAVATTEFIANVDGVEAGSAAAAVQTSRSHVGIVLVTVWPKMRRRGAGRALFDASASWARGYDVDELESHVELGDDESLSFATRRGFDEVSRDVDVELVLADVEAPRVDAPDGVDIVLLADRPELALGAYDVGLEALPDVPGSDGWTPLPYEDFVEAHLRGPAIFVAVAGDEVVAYAKLHDGADGTSAEHGMTAVKRPWRGKGIAQSLKRAQIVWAKENGLERLTAENDERNVPMRRINDALGYRKTAGWITLRARVADLRLR